ncbi:CBS domain-containing protein [Streptomyces sp. R302]|uniref:CBS domain-containing protein n=1 Tax=unclassified Streptomyces TaxID=2593676 RepID=UPI00145E9604|nr:MULTISPECIES: CBS domain-containing protein [unclassified Streptomyces]NML51082.1 CBS domain-containing protein [Streptomyces sp. R301]NML81177.1 CBS domain-containing protein [Streptomyces sp. R302]
MKHLKVGGLMTDDVISARPDMSFRDVAKLLAEHDISGLPVVDADDHVVGVVSESDLPARRAPTARGVMSAPAVTVHAEEAAADAARLMVRRGVERLPVVDEEERLVGIVTRRDLLRVFLRPDAEIRRRIREEVLADAMDLPADAVDVHVLDGVVTLGGRVRLRSQAVMLRRLAERVEGVVAVVDRLSARDDGARVQARPTLSAHDFS